MSGKTVLLVGATRGLGLALAEHYLARGWTVHATTVEPSSALSDLAERNPALCVHALDVTDRTAGEALRAALGTTRLDAVHIVAGVFQAGFEPIWELGDAEILRVLGTNSISPVRLAELFAPMVPEGGVFAFTSSGMGSMARNDKGDVDLYRISKAALNMLVRSFAARHAGSGRAVILFCPGWAKTDMGGPDATVEVADSVDGMLDQVEAARPADGAIFREYTGDTVPW